MACVHHGARVDPCCLRSTLNLTLSAPAPHFRYCILFPIRLALLLVCTLSIIAVFTVLTTVLPASRMRRDIERKLVQVGEGPR